MGFWWLLLALPAGVWLAGRLGLWAGQPPTHLGVTDGRLAPPSPTRNSVSSQAHLHTGHPQTQTAQIEPLRLHTPPEQAIARVAQTLAGQPGVRVVTQTPHYLRLEAQTPFWRFVDDVEFHADGTQAGGLAVVQVRSASRLGREDFGANRQRIEGWRPLLEQAPADPDRTHPQTPGSP